VTTKRFICLANSRKLNGRCVAGVEIVNGQPTGWIRPVSGHGHGEVSESDRRYKEGGDPALRDIIDATFKEAKPEGHQPENWLIDDQYYWVKRGRFKRTDLAAFVVPEGPLWGFGRSTYNGCNDELTPAEAKASGSSLALIWVKQLEIRVFQPGLKFGDTKRRVQGRFKWGGRAYWLWVTDPVVERAYLRVADGQYMLGPHFLTISIGEPKDDRCYKLIAGIIEDET
jgi:hypothetical protein